MPTERLELQSEDPRQREIASLEEKNSQLGSALKAAREQLTQLHGRLEQMQQPPLTLAHVISVDENNREIEVILGGRRMLIFAAPSLDLGVVSVGQMVRVNQDLVAIDLAGFVHTGLLVKVIELVGSDRVIVTMEGGQEQILVLAGPLRHGGIQVGDCVLADLKTGHALENVTRSDVEQVLTPEVPNVTYEDIGGLETQIQQVRDSLEMPLLHPELYRQYGLRPPKGILLYGPPGSGKTLIAKAVAHSLSNRGQGVGGYFLSIKGPELLNKFVGETERHIRSIFARARELALDGTPVVIFFDEMEALFRVRGSGISSDVETMIVPQLLAEMDGIESLDNVIIVGASNRADMIDPAVLRPGRLDVRIRINRPSRSGARDIFSKYLNESVPLCVDEVSAYGNPQSLVNAMIEKALEMLYAEDDSTALFDAHLANGKVTRLYLHDIVSGALIASSVERAKKRAIIDTLNGEGSGGMRVSHLVSGVCDEMRESIELATTSSPSEWGRTVGFTEEIVSVRSITQESI